MRLKTFFQRRTTISPAVREEMIDMAENLRRQGEAAEAVQVEGLLGIYKAPSRKR